MSLSLQLLEEQPEAVEAGLTHPEQRVGAAHLAEVWSAVAAAGVEDVGLAEHILDHEVLALQRETRGGHEKPPRLLCDVCVGGKSRTRRRRNEKREETRTQTARQAGLLPNQQESLPRRSVTFSPLFVPQRLLIILVFSCLFFMPDSS